MESTSEAAVSGAPPRPPGVGSTVAWAGQTLTLTACVGIIAKILGVLIVPGSRGVLTQRTVETLDTAASTFAYVLAAMLVALVCASSFELARASPAVVMRLHTLGSLALAVTTSALVLTAGIVALRAHRTRAVATVLVLLSSCALLRLAGWEAAAIGGESASPALYEIGRVLATIAVALHTITVLLAAAWIGTRSKIRGRVLANAAILLAFVITYVAARPIDGGPGETQAILRGSLAEAAGVPIPYALGSVVAFLQPASILLACAAILQRREGAAIGSVLALALLSHGAYDVPLQALAAVAAAQWAMLASADGRAGWRARLRPTASPAS